MKNSILDDSVLIVIPARGGSKGIPNKNIRLVNGIPLIEYTINFARKLTNNSNILVSTDSHKIAEISKNAGATCPFLRPNELATDLTGDLPVLRHAVNKYQDLIKKKYDFVLMLQPTSPVRFENQVIEAMTKILKNKYDIIISLTQVSTKFHALKQFEIADEKLKVFSSRALEIITRQQLPSSYIRNGVLYLFSKNYIDNFDHVYSINTGYIIVNEIHFNIDELGDLLEFEKYIINS
jgi:CMP-N,N'-diacetyllegionaminic acid synthase